MLKERLVKAVFYALIIINCIFIASGIILTAYMAILPAIISIISLIAAYYYLFATTRSCVAMNTENSLIRGILDELRIAVFDIDAGQKTTPLNSAATTLLMDMDAGQITAEAREAFAGAVIKRKSSRIRLKDGTEKSLQISALPVENHPGVTNVRVIAFDADERLRLSTELKTAREEIIENQKRLKKTIEDLEEFALLAIRREQKMVEIRKRIAAENALQ